MSLQLHHQQVVQKELKKEIPRMNDYTCILDLHRTSLREPQLIPIPASVGEDDQPPHEERQRERSRSRERVHPHAQVPQVHKLNLRPLQNLMMVYEMRILQL